MSTMAGTLAKEKGIAAFIKSHPLAALTLVWMTRGKLGYKPEFSAKK